MTVNVFVKILNLHVYRFKKGLIKLSVKSAILIFGHYFQKREKGGKAPKKNLILIDYTISSVNYCKSKVLSVKSCGKRIYEINYWR